jgi:cell division protein FtsB
MCFKKINFWIISLIFIIVFCNSLFAYTINSIDIDENYISSSTNAYLVTVELESSTTDNITLNISSLADESGLDFNITSSSTTISCYFYTTTSSTTTQNGWPKIQVNSTDVITITAQDKSDNVFYDSVNPNTSSFSSINVIEGTNYNNFYSGSFILNFNASTDDYTFVDHYILYVINIDDLEDYNSSYNIFETDNNSTLSFIIDPDVNGIVDGNYYFLIDVVDAAGNKVTLSEVIDTKENIYIDNTIPNYSNPNIGIINDSNIVYVSTEGLDLEIEVDDISGINSEISKMEIYDPQTIKINPNSLYSSGSFSYSTSLTYEHEDVFQFKIDAYDMVNNLLDFDFNVVFDLVAPTIPGKASTFLSIDQDKNVTITWTASSDTLSGLDHYEVYRSTSSFSTITNQTKIYTTSGTSTLTYEDTSSKDEGRSYYYGVVAVDKAGNESLPAVGSIHSGPELDIEIANGDNYTNLTTPKIEVTFSSDVNEMRFSCNESSWSSWIEVSGSSEIYYSFNITSGNGCNSNNELKRIYVQVRSENDYPNRTSKASDTIRYDSIAPPIPTNIVVQELNNGSLKVSWNESEDNNSDVTYFVYYSLENDVSLSSNYFETDDLEYYYNPNDNVTVYFKILAEDEAENRSSLSSAVYGDSSRIGPKFSLIITPSNVIDNEIYVGEGLKTITITSDEELNSQPTVRISFNSGSFVSLPITYNNLTITTSYDFQESGFATIMVSGANLDLETAIDEFNLIVDSNTPVFDFNYTVNENGIYDFIISNFSSDIFRVQYLLNNNEEICKKEFDLNNLENADFNCVFDSNTFEDNTYSLYILAYDLALNVTTKIVDFIIDNIDEIKLECDSLKIDIDQLIEELDSKIIKLEQLFIEVDLQNKNDLIIAKEKRDLGIEKYDLEDYNSAKTNYVSANNLLLELKDKLPLESIIKTRNISRNIDSNLSKNIKFYTSDYNVSFDTNQLYHSNSISYDRNFFVQEINSKKYFSTTLEIKNSSASSKTITIVETIPKSFAKSVKNLVFNREVEILVEDPLIKYTLTIPANSSDIFRYNRIEPITDVDVITTFNTIEFEEPIILSGNVSSDKIIFNIPVNYTLLIYIIGGMLFLLFLLVILSIISKNNKLKSEQLVKPTTKQVVNSYFGKDKEEELEKQKKESQELKDNSKDLDSENKNTKDTTVEDNKNDKFNEDYAYILNAIKKR